MISPWHYTRTLIDRLKTSVRRWQRSAPRSFTYENLLRSDLFSAGQMAEHGTHLAHQHRSSLGAVEDALLARLADNEQTLVASCAALTATLPGSHREMPAAQWLLDNFYLVEAHIRIARRHLPHGYSRQLPRLDNGPSSGLPRVYDIALETISHGDGRVDVESLSGFVDAYQKISPLTLGELWAIPIMLRLALIENLRRVAARVMANWADRDLANEWADRLSETAELAPRNMVLVVADMARSAPPMSPAFVAELARRLQGQTATLIQPLAWIEQVLSESALSIERQMQLDAQQQAIDQVSISNSIGSLRLLSTTDWRDFVERLSHVERTLCQDPAAIYPAMDFASRDHYRHIIERLARHCPFSEDQVARVAVDLSYEATAVPGDPAAHVGFYLAGTGLALLEQRLTARISLAQRWQRWLHRAPLAFYLTPVALLSVLFAWVFLRAIAQDGWPVGVLISMSIPIVLMTSSLAIGLINWLVTLTVTPAFLPRLDYRTGIAEEARTLVAIPTLIASEHDVEELVEGLEVRFLANRDQHIHFALLSDFMDASCQSLPEDDALLDLATRCIEGLNSKYPSGAGDRFFLLHRPRRWNALERVWMGYERKRGKLLELNALLRGQGQDRFMRIAGDITGLGKVRYVITLDTDTQLPRGSASQLVGAMQHPLNHPRFAEQTGAICSGYAILQPRVGISLPSAARSTYARLFGSDAGVDPYTRAVSDVYQDLFLSGSFIGKGIYALDAFEQALDGCFADNRVLSHDLIEGCYAHSGLLSDVQLFETYPSRYSADVKRRHRWIRGDWQLLPWIVPWWSGSATRCAGNRLTALSRWKIFDNLRRSLEPVAFLSVLLWGWLASSAPALWTLAVMVLLLTRPLLNTLLELLAKTTDVPLAEHLPAALRTSATHFVRSGLALAWLPFEAWYSLDAVGRTLWRLLISKRRLLQWNPSREEERASATTLAALYREQWIAPALSLALAGALSAQPAVLALLSPVLVLWLLGPAIAWWLSRPRASRAFTPSSAQRRFLHRLARSNWAFFDHYVGPEDNWLVPDNIQEAPYANVAHRTSPTNLGMALLAHLAAHDFGYLSAGRLLDRLTLMLDNMGQLERYKGHFYNWYDTRTGKPLLPWYVSTVDSGNLSGLLLTLRPGLLAMADTPLLDPRVTQGLLDTLDSLLTAFDAAARDTADLRDLREQTLKVQEHYSAESDAWPMQLAELLQRLTLHTAASCTTFGERDDPAFWSAALNAQCTDLLDELQRFEIPAGNGTASSSWRDLAAVQLSDWPPEVQPAVARVQALARERIARAEQLASQITGLANADFTFLYDPHRDLFSIGYTVDDHRLDLAFYDLLASEMRLTNYVAIALGQVPHDSWFALGRLLTSNTGVPVLLSWSGSMFEYLMPMLVMPSYEGTLLDQTCHAAVARQIEHGQQSGIPWGVSESAYNAQDVHLNYQYRAFGVPGLGLKRGLGEERVVAPYASALALMVAPAAACRNLQRLSELGLAGRFGLYEAVDFTETRLPPGQDAVVIRSFMAHHQGMSFLALTSMLLDQPMQRRFASEPSFQACVLLLQERVPKTAAQYLHTSQAPALDETGNAGETRLRVFNDPNRRHPAVQLLSNGRYHVMVNNTGCGYSRRNELAITRWQEDVTQDGLGNFCYLRDIDSGVYWSTTYQPTRHKTRSHEAIFSDGRAEFRIRELDFDCHTEMAVSAEDDTELRRLHLTNHGERRRSIELTSYAEVVLAPAISDALHPAFSKLFVQTELIRSLQAIVCTRRPRSRQDAVLWMCHVLAVHGTDIDAISYETDRARFIGRGRTLAAPAAMERAVDALSGSAGAVLDPIVSIRCRITLDPGQTAILDLATGVADEREACLKQIAKYRDRHLADRVFDLAWPHSQVLLRQLNGSLADARLFEQMAASVIYANPSLRANTTLLASNRRNQSGLWGQGISGDLPIVLVQIGDGANIQLVKQMVHAHAYWRQKGLALDLVIWNEDQAGYRQQLQDLIMGVVTSGSEAALLDRPGGIFVRPAQQLCEEDRTLMLSVARLVLSDTQGSLGDQLRSHRALPAPRGLEPERTYIRPVRKPVVALAPPLMLANAYGGFSELGREYVIDGQPPAPWVNVLANPHFGTVVSESGSAYTWRENAHEFRLTPWYNDPVSDPCGEALYLRDEEDGHYWSPTPQPCPGPGSYRTRHGFGYSVFEYVEEGLRSELWVYVALEAPIQFTQLKLFNTSGRPRRLSVTRYVEWVLGDLRSKSAMHVVNETDPATGALFARNAWSIEFSDYVAFLDCDLPFDSITCDRSEFLGRNGDYHAPAAMRQARLSGRLAAGMDPCAAVQVRVTLEDGERREVVFRLGADYSAKAASQQVRQYRKPGAALNELERVRAWWRHTLDAVQIETPDPTLDVLVNGWLMYQVIACRFQARSGFYQSGGAFGFRDQLQDSMAMIHTLPDVVRQHLLTCAAHQYVEGDVQHWWHPPLQRGVRTRCSDDLLWLPLATSRYVEITGDRTVLDEPVGYLEGRALNPGEESYYDLPARSAVVETLYQHCQRALDHGLKCGAQGLPLMGSGDWNDGMNRVGEQGRGESVWLGFFGHHVLQTFARLAQRQGDSPFALQCAAQAAALHQQLEARAWDGQWYRRAWFDDGQVLGSASNQECRIDSLSQSWAVLSDVASAERARTAMNALDRHLVRRDIGIVQLLAPAFDKGSLDPGYIKGYVPGVRENGGQYTHAAIWAAMAFARMGDGTRAWELLDMINPVRQHRGQLIETYKVEPYVMAADVYAVPPHEGRGGWSWYTGSAGWMYRLIVESLLGLQRQGDTLRIRPLLPTGWPGYTLHYRFGSTRYRIEVRNEGLGELIVTLDGRTLDHASLHLEDDGIAHEVIARRLPTVQPVG